MRSAGTPGVRSAAMGSALRSVRGQAKPERARRRKAAASSDIYPYLALDTGGTAVVEPKQAPQGRSRPAGPGQRPGSENPSFFGWQVLKGRNSVVGACKCSPKPGGWLLSRPFRA
jgi:hypothetical protein